MSTDDAHFFLAELAVMLAGDPEAQYPDQNRETRLFDGHASAKTFAAFVVEGPESVDEVTTRDWLLERYLADSHAAGRDFLSSVLRGFLPTSAKQVLFAGAGPCRYVAVAAFTRTVDKLTNYKFNTPESLLGNGWHLSPLYAAVSAAPLKDVLDEESPGSTRTMGGRLIAGALRVAGDRAQA